MTSDEVPSGLADALRSGDYDAAVDWLLREKWPQGVPVLDAAYHVADTVLTADPKTAARVLLRLIERAEVAGDTPRVVEARQMHIDACCRLHQVRAAEASFDLLRPLLDEMPVKRRRRYLSNIAVFFHRAGELERAEEMLRAVIASHEVSLPSDLSPDDNREARRGLAVAHVNLATIHADPQRSDWDTALAELERADAAVGDADLPDTIGSIWFNRGHIEIQRGNHGLGIAAYERARACYLAGSADPYDLACVDRNEAGALGRVGRADEARALQESAIERFLGAGAFDEAARSEIGRFAALPESSPPSAAEQRAASARLAAARPSDLAELWMNQGNLALQADDPTTALTHFDSARRSFARQQRRIDVARTDLNRAVAFRKLDRPLTARRILQRVRRTMAATGEPRLVALADNNLAAVSFDLGEYERGRDEILAAIAYLDGQRHRLPSAQDRLSLTTVTYPRLFDLAIAIAGRLGDLDLLAALIERSRLQVGPGRDPGSLPAPRPVQARPGAEAVPGEAEPVDLTATAVAIGGSSTHWLSWAVHHDRLVRCHLTDVETFADAVPLAPNLLATLQISLPGPHPVDEAASDTRTRRRLSLYRVARGPLLGDPGLAERLAATLPWRARTAIDAAVNPTAELDPRELLTDLAELLLPDSILSRLGGEPIGVVLAPPPTLGYVPWAALMPSGTDQCLVERANLYVAPPVSLLTVASVAVGRWADASGVARRDAGGATGLWVADPRGDLPFCRYLPGDPWQVFSAATDPAATSEVVTAALGAGPGVLVIRGHVRAGEASDPSSTALLLSGGTELSARELATLGGGARVCILLGCDASGAGTGLEWTSVATGLLATGAETVVTTQFAVIDDQIQERHDLALVDAVVTGGPAAGTWHYQRTAASAWRHEPTPANAPVRWANVAVISRAGGGGGEGGDAGDGNRNRLSLGVGDEEHLAEHGSH